MVAVYVITGLLLVFMFSRLRTPKLRAADVAWICDLNRANKGL
jgi:hypothetical protein